ncbi:hypothetical protein INT45_001470, partial [Circinella minor]
MPILSNFDRSVLLRLLFTTTGGLVVYYYYYYHVTRSILPSTQKLKKIPIPKGRVPYFGHLFSLTDSPSNQLARWQKELGPIMCVSMGVKSWIFLGDPDLAHDLLGRHGAITSNRPFQTFTHYYYSKNRGIVFNNPSPEWNKTRAAVLQFISPKIIAGLNHILEPEADALVQNLLDASIKHDQHQVDIIEPLQLASMNIILCIGFGKRASSTSDSLFQAVMTNLEKTIEHANMVRDMRTFLPAFSIFDYLFRPGMKNFIEKDTNPLYRQLINEAHESNVDCLVNKLRELGHMDEKTLMVTMSDVIAGGSDTIAITAAWALVILCCYQETQRAVRKEVDQFIVTYKRLPSFTDRNHLPLLVSVQKECMRYRVTSAFGLLHETSKDVTCRGYFIRKGTTIVSNMRAIHMNPDVYNDPEKFMPERFMNRLKPMATCANSNPQERDHFVFGWGRRTCPGIHMAEVEIYNILVRLLAKTTIEPMISKEGNPIYPDLDKLVDAGGLIMPKDRVLRINKRTDSPA